MTKLESIQKIRALMKQDMAKHGADIGVIKADMNKLRARPHLQAQLEPLRGWIPTVTLEALRAMPPGSFGRAYGRFLEDNGLQPFILTEAVDAEMRARNAYGIRYAGTHDMLHALTGFGADYVGEMGVLAFTCGQDFNTTIWVQAAFAWASYPLLSGFKIGALIRAWRRGFAMGKQAPFMLAERLEEQFEQPLAAVQERYGLLVG
jgi:ubiquinone biosynthesis protein COQ4